MEGDRLARGARFAQFPGPHRDADITVPVRDEIFSECRDCDRTFHSAEEFSEHLEECDENKDLHEAMR